MIRIMLKSLLFLVGLAVVALGGYAVYISAVLGFITPPGVEELPRAEIKVVDNKERELLAEKFSQDLSNDNFFDVTLTQDELNRALAVEIGQISQIGRLELSLRPAAISMEGVLQGRTDIPFAGEISIHVGGGTVSFLVRSISVGLVSLPSFANRVVDGLMNEVSNLNQILSESEISVSAVEVGEGKIRIVGQGQITMPVEDLMVESREPTPAPTKTPDGIQQLQIPQPRTQSDRLPNKVPKSEKWVYLALGDSLAVGEGATHPDYSYAARFTSYLDATYDTAFGFQNFGVSGESSNSMIHGVNEQLNRTIMRIRELNSDNNPSESVHIITLSVGANDVFPVLQGLKCRANPLGDTCSLLIDQAVIDFGVNIDIILSRLREAAGSNTHILLMTYYNPFSFGTGLPFETVSNSTVKILNDQIRTIASRHSVIIANAHLLFGDLAVALTHVLLGDIHPNNAGYGVVLRAFQDAYEEVGPFSGGATP